MPIFNYKAIAGDGRPIEGQIDAPDRFAVYRKIKSDGQTAIFVKEETAGGARILKKVESFFGKVKTQEKITFARNLSSMIGAGLSVTRAISVMEKQTRNKKLKQTLADLLDNVSKGKTLGDSMKEKPDIFSPLFVSMVRAGEESGNLAGSLKIVALQMDKSYAIVKKVRGAMIYPTIIISLMFVIGILMMVYMVPTLTSTFEGLGVELPLSTRVIIWTSQFLVAHFALVIFGFIFLIALFILFVRNKKGKRILNNIVLRLPVIGGMVKEVNSARTARTLSSLLSSGVDIIVALGVTKDVLQNTYYKDVLGEAQIGVEKGDTLSSIFVQHEKLFPIFVGEMMSVGEETGKMSEMLINVATFYEDSVDQKTKDMSTIIEPVLMIIIGIGVGIFAISMLLPTYSLVDSI
ncbi:MAG: hypothetical protein COV07_00935 [Candidatus Vogelbacteria bacterium CG10_big_fil_rev_8_21_14_0_10_45_14]|uniref:Type II secretion system protein GspF domain-containing protein n=2 Tax=Parcubacteria group TaxID=1794811 RepID=A0A2H0K633_9BACT|nr:MAG: hypothetical protein COV95_02625 [Candidatus Zambryskibacteria bacterium CG11_big_fil_rev_8_21_14_0_20_40_24]PIR47062.1 MAG: hypothetical protein COV07_00935 [Candidatus Vogelbacteria bacterium CG10_big_fil_rev_8_21_14_0_10_45_14]PJA36997.1 MAG: hypothetical protein CO183_00515 [Candidatus Zambryskibacteria bacterium CG_4_9_14_3_um_filter_42_9]